MTRIGSSLRETRVIKSALKARYERKFITAHGIGCLSGEYATFRAAAAAAAARGSLPVGYDVAAAGALYAERMQRVLLKDYPALFWLAQMMPTARRLFDIGGHVGLMYYSYQRYLSYRADFTWTVCDVPAVIVAGETIARERSTTNLRFTSELDAAAGSDVILATGSLQYIERPIADLLGALPVRPTHVLINETPTHEQREIVTLQNIGIAICPYRIVVRQSVIDALRALGYELVDSWEDTVRRTDIPYVTEGKAIAYSGFYFRLA